MAGWGMRADDGGACACHGNTLSIGGRCIGVPEVVAIACCGAVAIAAAVAGWRVRRGANRVRGDPPRSFTH